jgi:hypothetical protein
MWSPRFFKLSRLSNGEQESRFREAGVESWPNDGLTGEEN